jgi:hypothetical protein
MSRLRISHAAIDRFAEPAAIPPPAKAAPSRCGIFILQAPGGRPASPEGA